MKKLLRILWILVGSQIFASQDSASAMNRLVMTPNSSVGSLLSDGSSAFSQQNELCYEKIMQSKLQYQQALDAIEQSFVVMAQKETVAVAQFNKYSELIRKEEVMRQENQVNLSPDKAYAILKEYQEREKGNTLSPYERARMMRMKSGLDMINEQVKIAVEQVKGVTISEILSTYPCNVIYPGIQSDCLAHQAEIIAMYQNNIDQSILQQRALAEQKKLKIKDRSIIASFVQKMDELSEVLVVQNSAQTSPLGLPVFNTNIAIVLQSLYRMQKVLNGQELIGLKLEAQQRMKAAKIAEMSQKKASQFKNNLAGLVIDSIFEKAFIEIDKNELMRWQKKQDQLQETANNQKMVGAILTSVIDKAALAGELNVQARLKAEKIAVHTAKNKAVQQQAQQAKIAKEIAAKEAEAKQLKEIESQLVKQTFKQELAVGTQSAVQINKQEVVIPEQFVVNRKNIIAKAIDLEQRKKNRFTHLQALRSAGIVGNDLKLEMARYDEYLHKFDTTTVSDFLLNFQKMLKPSTLNDSDSWESFLQAMDSLKNNACDLDIDESGRVTINRKITELFNMLYPQFGYYNADLVEQHIHNQECILESCKNSLEVCNQALNQAKAVKRRLLIQSDIKKIEEERKQASELLGEAFKAQNMFYIMTKLRKLQVFCGVFQKQIVSPCEYHDFVIDKFYEVKPLWMQEFEKSKKIIQLIMQKKLYVECSDCQALLLDQYTKFNVPASDLQLAVFDSVYLLSNMLESKVDLGSELELQHKLFVYLHHTYPTYSLELIEKMTKTQMMLFVIMKKISVK